MTHQGIDHAIPPLVRASEFFSQLCVQVIAHRGEIWDEKRILSTFTYRL